MATIENKEFDSIFTLQNSNIEEFNTNTTGEPEKEEKKNQSRNPFIILWDTVQQWAEDTTFHCVKYVLGKEVNIVRRLFWLAVIALMWYGLVSGYMSQLQRFLDYKPITRETVRFEQQIEFPSVTVCTSCLLHDNDWTDPLEKQIIVAALDSYYSGDDTYMFGNISYKHMKLHEMTINMSMPVESLFYECVWRGEYELCEPSL